MCNTAWSGSKSELREVSKLRRKLIILICLIWGTCTAGALAFAGPVTSMTQSSVLEGITQDAASDATANIPPVDAGGRFRIRQALLRLGPRADWQRDGLGLVAPLAPVIRVASASSAKRAAERAVGGRAVKVVRKGRRFVVTVISGGNAKRCTVDAQSGQVLGCR